MKRIVSLAALVAIVCAPSFGQMKRFQLAAFGGVNPVFAYGSNDDYSAGVNDFPVTPAHTPAGLGASLTFFLSGRLGIELRGEVALASQMTLTDPSDQDTASIKSAKHYAGGVSLVWEPLAAGRPFEAVIVPLQQNARYCYRMRVRRPGEFEFQAREEHFFRTQRAAGETFVFDIEADPHLDENSSPELYRQTLENILAEAPDFLIDLGDTFFSEKQPVVSWDTVVARHLLLRTYFDRACHSVPLFFALGNHEGEWGYRLDGTENNLAVWATKARLLYYPNPLPDRFYSGNTSDERFIGLREDYYAFEWGNALFVVLDPYWYTMVKSSTDNWTMTLGERQYLWLKNVLETSSAKYKFVFCHQLVGGTTKDGRGGAEVAGFYEWGGKNEDGSWGFSNKRAGWALPIHQLMVKNGVTAFFHGHDHFYGKQSLDGIVYQEVPQPSHFGDSETKSSEYGYVDGRFIGGSGHLRVTVSPADVNVEFIRAHVPGQGAAAEIAYAYSVSAKIKKGGVRR